MIVLLLVPRNCIIQRKGRYFVDDFRPSLMADSTICTFIQVKLHYSMLSFPSNMETGRLEPLCLQCASLLVI